MKKAEFLAHFNAIESAGRAARINELSRIVHVSTREADYKQVVIVSPRSQSWRDNLSEDPLILSIPPDGDILTGNAGITTLDITSAGPGRYDLFLHAASQGLGKTDIDVAIEIKGEVRETVSIPIKDDGSSELFMPGMVLEPGKTSFILQVDDVLAEDNVGVVRNLSDTEREISVWLHGSTRPFIEAFLNSYPQFSPDQPGLPHNVMIFDSIPPDNDSEFPALVIFPTQPFDGFALKRVWATPLTARFHPGHPAVEKAVEFRHFRPGKILDYEIPSDFEILAEAEGIPLIVAGTQNGRPVVLWFFDPADNGIYLDPAFPVILYDTLLWLTRSEKIQTESALCQTSLIPDGTSESNAGNATFFECVAMIKEAAWISVPDLTKVTDRATEIVGSQRKELAKIFLLAALILLVIVSLDRAGNSGWER